MNQTSNYKLPQWVESDRIMMEDFNDAMAKIDAGIAGAQESADGKATPESIAELSKQIANCGNGQIAYGSYTGTGNFGKNTPNQLTFNFKPVLVVIGCAEHISTAYWPTVMMRGINVSKADNATYQNVVTWLDKGVSWWNGSSADTQNNGQDMEYYYVAIGYKE